MSTRFTKANVEYASAASTPDVTENYTSAGWVKWITNASTSVDDILRVTDNGGDLDIIGAINFFLPNWYLQCYDGYVGGQGQGSATIVEGQWYYVALVRSGGTTYLYVDFEVETSASFDASSRIAATHMRFGGNSDNPSDVELRGWKTFQRALSADEQRAESRDDMPLDATALFSVYPFLPGTRDQDYSGNGRTLTETNTPTDGASDPPGVGWGDDLIQVAAPSEAGVVVTPSTASLVLITFAPTVQTPRVATPSTAGLLLATFAPTVLLPKVVTPERVDLVLTTFAPTVELPKVVTPGRIDLVLTTFAPTVATGDVVVTPTTAVLVLTGYAPTVIGDGNVVVTYGDWLNQVTLLPGSLWRLRLEGPGLTSPSVRITSRFTVL